MSVRPSLLLLLAVPLLARCDAREAAGPEGRVAVTVAPLNLSGVTNAEYTLAVTNGPNGTGETVWTKALSSTQYGDGAGSLSYVGPCDASTGTNTVTLTLTALYDASGLVPVGSYMNPTPISRQATCVENTDVPVQFDITLARQADQGFFDIAVQFKDLFCSAKLDCQKADGSDLELLHAPGGGRDMTAVLGFACTGSLSGPTYLYMDDVVVDCAGTAYDAVVEPTGLGSVTPAANPGAYLFGAAVYRGVEGLANKAYWNVALGLDQTKFLAAGTCTLRGRATAADAAWPQTAQGFPIPTGTVYPVVDWQVTLSEAAAGGRRACTTHAVNAPSSGVATSYVGHLPLTNGFTWSATPITLRYRFEAATGIVLAGTGPSCTPACAHGACVADTPTDRCECDDGWTGTACDEDVDECALGTDDCDPLATCTDTSGAFACACPAGAADAHGDGTLCTFEDCLALHLALPALGDGLYTLDPDGPGGAAPFTTRCDMTTDGGGWTLLYTSSDDGVATFTWNNRFLLSTQTDTAGDPQHPERDFKSPALHRLPFTALLFRHAPSGRRVRYGVHNTAASFGAFVASVSAPHCPGAANVGYKELSAALTANPGGAAPKLCDTDLYFNLGDNDGSLGYAVCTNLGASYNNATYGPGWNTGNNDGCNFDDADSGGTGPSNPCGLCGGAQANVETAARGFAGPLGLNTGAAGSAANYLQVYSRDYPLASCLEWRKAGATTSGAYAIDPDGPTGATAPLDVYCDMTYDGGGWTLLSVGGTPCPVISSTTSTSTPTPCTYLPDVTVRATAQNATEVRLCTGSSFGTWTANVRSNNTLLPITALRSGTGWHFNGAGADHSGYWTGWAWRPLGGCGGNGGTGWPNVYHSCSDGAGVHWLMAPSYLAGFFQQPNWNGPWSAVTATWIR